MKTPSKHWVGVVAYFLIVTTICGCGTEPKTSTSGPWKQAGLKETSINKFNKYANHLYAATNKGLYLKKKGNTDWTSLGLHQKEVLNAVLRPDNEILAAVRISDFSQNIPSLFLSLKDENKWKPYMQNYGGDTEVTWVGALGTTKEPSDTIFARGGGLMVARSVNSGKSWHLTNGKYWDLWGGQSSFIKADPYHEKRVWTGGSNQFWTAYLLKSTDSGETWLSCKVSSSNSYDILSFPKNKRLLLVAVSGKIQKSTNSCETWQTVIEDINAITLTHSARNPEIVYASGENANGNIFFATSGDFGDSWETVEWEDHPDGVQVNDMVSVMEDGREVLYFGTNQGVYSYRFEE